MRARDVVVWVGTSWHGQAYGVVNLAKAHAGAQQCSRGGIG